jgi:hypothetical protein
MVAQARGLEELSYAAARAALSVHARAPTRAPCGDAQDDAAASFLLAGLQDPLPPSPWQQHLRAWRQEGGAGGAEGEGEGSQHHRRALALRRAAALACPVLLDMDDFGFGGAVEAAGSPAAHAPSSSHGRLNLLLSAIHWMTDMPAFRQLRAALLHPTAAASAELLQRTLATFVPGAGGDGGG